MTNNTLLSLIVLCVSLSHGFAQAVAEDTVKADRASNKYVPTGVRIGYDLISGGKSYFQDNYSGLDLQADVDFDRYNLVFEYGNSALNRASDSATYDNKGNYWRLGIDVNFLTKDPDRNVFFLGARYGRSSFSETLDITRFDPDWGLHSETFHHSGISASWIELAAGLKVKIWKMVWLGYTARFKFALKAKHSPEMMPYEVPGYGFNEKEATWGFNYYLMIRLPR